MLADFLFGLQVLGGLVLAMGMGYFMWWFFDSNWG